MPMWGTIRSILSIRAGWTPTITLSATRRIAPMGLVGGDSDPSSDGNGSGIATSATLVPDRENIPVFGTKTVDLSQFMPAAPGAGQTPNGGSGGGGDENTREEIIVTKPRNPCGPSGLLCSITLPNLTQPISFAGIGGGSSLGLQSTQAACKATTFSGDATYYNLKGNTTASGQPFDPNSNNAAMYQPGQIHLGDSVTVQLQNSPNTSITVTVNDSGPFARGPNGLALHPLQPDPNIVIDLTPQAFTNLAGGLAVGRVPVNVTKNGGC